MEKKIISGIQQIGIGIENVKEAWKWYNHVFGTDIRVFEDSTVAELMLPYTGGVPQKRHAALAFNLQGGGGFEIWQYTERVPQKAHFDIQLGDLGIFAAKIKCKDIQETYNHLKKKNIDFINEPQGRPDGEQSFFIKDPFGNHFQLVETDYWYKDENKLTGGTYGAIIGVSDIDKARKVYSEILGYDKVIYDKEDTFDDFNNLPGGKSKFRRILLTHTNSREGGFSQLLGDSQIELIEVKDRTPKHIYQDRFWGDLGFIHLCFDIHGMKALRKECEEKGFNFTVDSHVKHNNNNSFDMGEAAGHFSYIEDPDGTLIEFVETHKVPIIKKFGWYINLRKRNPRKPLPNWMIKALSFNRVKHKK
jgi:catechol 2,3-dioxygenase-like lactoylglutathione lyase family enzyme